MIGGPGAFVIAAKDFETFGEAILKKLIAEIANVPAPLELQASAAARRFRFRALAARTSARSLRRFSRHLSHWQPCGLM